MADVPVIAWVETPEGEEEWIAYGVPEDWDEDTVDFYVTEGNMACACNIARYIDRKKCREKHWGEPKAYECTENFKVLRYEWQGEVYYVG